MPVSSPVSSTSPLCTYTSIGLCSERASMNPPPHALSVRAALRLGSMLHAWRAQTLYSALDSGAGTISRPSSSSDPISASLAEASSTFRSLPLRVTEVVAAYRASDQTGGPYSSSLGSYVKCPGGNSAVSFFSPAEAISSEVGWLIHMLGVGGLVGAALVGRAVGSGCSSRVGSMVVSSFASSSSFFFSSSLAGSGLVHTLSAQYRPGQHRDGWAGLCAPQDCDFDPCAAQAPPPSEASNGGLVGRSVGTILAVSSTTESVVSPLSPSSHGPARAQAWVAPLLPLALLFSPPPFPPPEPPMRPIPYATPSTTAQRPRNSMPTAAAVSFRSRRRAVAVVMAVSLEEDGDFFVGWRC
mmetsp:Transcript_2078/g.4628  ORF Transcript_2078/g.4628 Transcript_2078/m.4628 type:complete len:355 (-) Transcript_2078:248-1312(-)